MENVNKTKITDLEANKNIQGLEEMMTEAEGGYDLETAELVKQALDRVNGVSEKIDSAEEILEATEKRVEDLGGSKEIVEEKLGENTVKMEDLKKSVKEEVKDLENNEEEKIQIENESYKNNEKAIEGLNLLKKSLQEHLDKLITFRENHGAYSVSEYVKDANYTGGGFAKALEISPEIDNQLIETFKEYYQNNPNPDTALKIGGNPNFIVGGHDGVTDRNTFKIKNFLNEVENDFRAGQMKILLNEGEKIGQKIGERSKELGYENSGKPYAEMDDKVIKDLLQKRDFISQQYTKQASGMSSSRL